MKDQIDLDKPEIPKLLVISFSFFPDDSPNTYRWKNIIDIWIRKGIDVFVVSVQKEGFKEFEIVDGIKIYRARMSLFQTIKTKIGKSAYSKRPNSNAGSNANLLRKIYNYTWKKLYWPDWAFLTYYPILKLANKIIKQERIFKLITVSWPFTDHLIGYKIKRNNNIFWLADTIDPFCFISEINNNTLYSKLNFFVEKKVLTKADCISVITNRVKDKYLSLFPELEQKISVINNLCIPYCNLLLSHSSTINDVCKLVYIGTLSPKVRTPDNLLRLFKILLEKKLKIELHFYGKITYDIKCEDLINHAVFFHGYVPKDQVENIIQSASILINIGNSNPYQEPSKIVEYISSGKRILNICTIDIDTSKDLLSKYPGSYNINISEFEIDEKIDELVEYINTEITCERLLMDEILKPYRLEEIEKKYFNLLWNV